MLILCFFILSYYSAKTYSYANIVIDVSAHVHIHSFGEMIKSGIVAVIHKATEGTKHKDDAFDRRRVEAEKHNMLFGAIHVAHEGDPKKQADFFLKEIGNTKKLLLVLDLQRSKDDSFMPPEEAEDFVKRIKMKTGRFPVIYGGNNFLEEYNNRNLNRCRLWVASWTANRHPTLPKHRGHWVLWQYTDGRVGGAPRAVKGIGICSRSRFRGKTYQLRKKWPNL